MSKNTLPMPVKVKPYAHQQNAFDFVCGLFGLTTFEETSSGAALLMEMGSGKAWWDWLSPVYCSASP